MIFLFCMTSKRKKNEISRRYLFHVGISRRYFYINKEVLRSRLCSTLLIIEALLCNKYLTNIIIIPLQQFKMHNNILIK